MFAGIVIGMGTVAALVRKADGVRLVIDPGSLAVEARPGDSVCVSGCCLTHAPDEAQGRQGMLCFDVIQETLDKTKLGSLGVGDSVNLETSLTPSTPIGGHFVQGHVDGVGRICRVRRDAEETRVAVAVPAALMPYMIPKGSVSIDGISLTIAALDPDGCEVEVALIPTTLTLTTLGQAAEGEPVNLEADMLAKTIVHWLEHYAGGQGVREQGGGVGVDLLRQAGFAR
jgi:riboflavin synthase alpha subunit